MEYVVSDAIYELIRVELVERIDDNTSDCLQLPSGFFNSDISLREFIRKHEHKKNVFFIARVWVFNPTHYGQTHDNIYEYSLTCNGELICKNPTHHFVVNKNELNSQEATQFIGRDEYRLRKNSNAWFYDMHEQKLCRCKIGGLPFTTNQAKKFGWLDWYDDSYIVYPYPENKEDNHQHILSCELLTNTHVKNMEKEIE